MTPRDYIIQRMRAYEARLDGRVSDALKLETSADEHDADIEIDLVEACDDLAAFGAPVESWLAILNQHPLPE